jgi:hypothetical protein
MKPKGTGRIHRASRRACVSVGFRRQLTSHRFQMSLIAQIDRCIRRMDDLSGIVDGRMADEPEKIFSLHPKSPKIAREATLPTGQCRELHRRRETIRYVEAFGMTMRNNGRSIKR